MINDEEFVGYGDHYRRQLCLKTNRTITTREATKN
jgi:hypothetical protein